MNVEDLALLEVGRALLAAEYRFTTITPESHRRVNARPGNAFARQLRDVFGWSRPFSRGVVPAGLFDALAASGCLRREGERYASTVRFSSLDGALFVHSAFPTLEQDAVFFGPDTYRFTALLAREVSGCRRVVDVGCGSGAGGLSLRQRATEVVLADINPRALRFSEVNAALCGTTAALFKSDVLAQVPGSFDLVVANPPFLNDDGKRAYRDGGPRGIELSVRIATEAWNRVEADGRLILYTATPVVDGVDLLRKALAPVLRDAKAFRYEELDPDIFGEELERPAYQDAERLSLVACIATRGSK